MGFIEGLQGLAECVPKILLKIGSQHPKHWPHIEAHVPIVQSGGAYDLRTHALGDDRELSKDVIIPAAQLLWHSSDGLLGLG